MDLTAFMKLFRERKQIKAMLKKKIKEVVLNVKPIFFVTPEFTINDNIGI